MRLGLRWRLTAGFAAILVLLFGLILAFQVLVVHSLVRRSAVEDAGKGAHLAASAVDEFLARADDVIALRSFTPGLAEAVAGHDAARVRQLLRPLEGPGAGPFFSVFALDAQGAEVATSGRDQSGVGVSRTGRDYWLGAQRTAGVYHSSPYQGGVSKEPVMAVAHALRLPDGTFAGVLVGSLPLGRLRDELGTLGDRAAAHISVVDGQGIFLVASNPTRLMRPFPPSAKVAWQAMAGRPGAAVGGGSGGPTVYAAFPVQRLGDGNRAGVAISIQPLGAGYGALADLLKATLLALLLGLLAAFLLSFLVARAVTEPISALRRAVDSEEVPPAFPRAAPEVAALAAAYRRMALHVRQVRRALEWEVRRRTRELRQRLRVLRTLYAIGREVSSSLEVDHVMETIQARAKSLLRADEAGILLFADRAPDSGLRRYGDVFGHPVPAKLLRRMRTSARTHVIRPHDLGLAEADWSSGMWAALRHQGASLGMLWVRRQAAAPFLQADRELLAELAARAASAVANAHLYAAAQQRAEHDSATGLLNHGSIYGRLERELASDGGEPLGLALIDLDDFKAFNDTYGHLTGERVLATVSRTLQAISPSPGLVGRYGGDEFVALLPGADRRQLQEWASQFRTRLLRTGLEGRGLEEAVPIRCTVGTASYPEDGRTAGELIERADREMYALRARERDPGRQLDVPPEVHGLCQSLTAKDRQAGAHSRQVARIAARLGEQLSLGDEECRCLYLAGLLHDVGKLAVPDAIALKPGRLSEAEMEVMRRHVAVSAALVPEMPLEAPVRTAIMAHHERYDGLGYPAGLQGEEIPLTGQVLALADAYAAMTSDRVYRSAMSPEEARTEVLRCAGSQFSPAVVEAFRALVDLPSLARL